MGTRLVRAVDRQVPWVQEAKLVLGRETETCHGAGLQLEGAARDVEVDWTLLHCTSFCPTFCDLVEPAVDVE